MQIHGSVPYDIDAANQLESTLNTASGNLRTFMENRSALATQYLTYQDKVPEQGWVGTEYDNWARQFRLSQQKLAGFINQLYQRAVDVHNRTWQEKGNDIGNGPPRPGHMSYPPPPKWGPPPDNKARDNTQGATPQSLYSYSDRTVKANNDLFRAFFSKNLANAANGSPAYSSECASLARAIAYSLRWEIIELDARVRVVGEAFEKAGGQPTPGDPKFLFFGSQQQLDNAIGRDLQQEAVQLAQQVNKNGMTPAAWDELEANANNPAFTTAFFNTLNPGRLRWELLQPTTYANGDAPDEPNRTKALADALASAYATGQLSPAVEQQLVNWSTTYAPDLFLQEFLTALSENPQASLNFINTLSPEQFNNLAAGLDKFQGATQRQAAFLQVCASAMREMTDQSQALQFMDKIYNAFTVTTPSDMTDIAPALKTLLINFYSVYFKAPPTFPSGGNGQFDNATVLNQFIENEIAGDTQTGGKGAAYYAWGFSHWIYSTDQKIGNSQVFARQLAESVVLAASLAALPAAPAGLATITVASVEAAASGWAVSNIDGALFGSPVDPQDTEQEFYHRQAAYAQIQIATQLLAQGQLVYVDPNTNQQETITQAAAAAGKSGDDVLNWMLENDKHVEITATGQPLFDVMNNIKSDYFDQQTRNNSQGG